MQLHKAMLVELWLVVASSVRDMWQCRAKCHSSTIVYWTTGGLDAVVLQAGSSMQVI